MNIETVAVYVSYFIFQFETPIYPTALFQKHRLKPPLGGLTPLGGLFQYGTRFENTIRNRVPRPLACRSSPMSVRRSNVLYLGPSLQAHGCWKRPVWGPALLTMLKSRKFLGQISSSRAVWHLWAMDFSVNRLDRKPSPPRCHLQQRAHLTGCPTF